MTQEANKILINTENAFAVAVAFKKTALTARAIGPEYLNASLVNLAFATEVCLKCLYAIENPACVTDERFKDKKHKDEDLENVGYVKPGHCLKSLFKKLSAESQAAIASDVNNAIKAAPSKSGFLTCADGEYPQFTNIDEVLATVDDVFVRMRYTFEYSPNKPRSVVYMEELQAAIEARILTLVPIFKMWL